MLAAGSYHSFQVNVVGSGFRVGLRSPMGRGGRQGLPLPWKLSPLLECVIRVTSQICWSTVQNILFLILIEDI